MHVPYTSATAPSLPNADELRKRIPGWGVDADPAVRPSVPRERLDLAVDLGGAAPRPDGMPDRQRETWPRERSIEHATLTPVFGTACPPKGVSGALRRLAYRRYSEGRAAHWLLLVAADRVDALEEHLRSLVSLRPDNPITETGVRAELTHGGWSSRVGRRRSDTTHQPLDPVIVAGPWVAAGAAAVLVVRRVPRAFAARRAG